MFILFSRILRTGQRRHVGILLAAVVVCLFAGAGAFAATQHLPFTTGLYWGITTATTVGYGDVTPKNAVGRFIGSAVMLTCIPLLAAALALFTGATASQGLRKVLNMTSFPTGSYRIVVGMHPVVPAIIDELAKAKDNNIVLVADIDPAKVREDVHVVRGDPTEPSTLRRARPEGAVHGLITGKDDGDVLVSAVLLRKEAPDLQLSALVDSTAVREALQELGVSQTVGANDLLAHTMAKSLETPHAGDLFLKLIESEDHRLVEVVPDPAMVGKLLSAIRNDRQGLVLGLVRDRSVTLGIGHDPTVSADDKLLVAEPTR
jgi:voltage-gated potassium channel